MRFSRFRPVRTGTVFFPNPVAQLRDESLTDQKDANYAALQPAYKTATLTESGRAICDQMSVALLKLKDKKVELIGHTDNAGARASNLSLSQARAEAVKAYVTGKGIKPESIAVSGEGPDRPVADNRSADGRARNRRIEFKVVQ